jgi:hypothetical protein
METKLCIFSQRFNSYGVQIARPASFKKTGAAGQPAKVSIISGFDGHELAFFFTQAPPPVFQHRYAARRVALPRRGSISIEKMSATGIPRSP